MGYRHLHKASTGSSSRGLLTVIRSGGYAMLVGGEKSVYVVRVLVFSVEIIVEIIYGNFGALRGSGATLP